MLLAFINRIIHFDQTLVRNTPALNDEQDPFADLCDNVFLQNQRLASRFSDGSFPAWYGSRKKQTTFYETSFHWVNTIINDIQVPLSQTIYQTRSLFSVQCQSILLDLRHNIKNVPELIDPARTAHIKTQAIGHAIYQQGHPGIVVKSARHQKGENVVIFNRQMLQQASYIGDVLYQYSPTTQKVLVSTADNSELLVEI